MGAIAAGCRFYSGYPITPATDVMEYLTGRIERFGGHVMQAEDELSAINMALGAARAGARSMTATSGPGIDLMTETFGLIAHIETPLVICDVMRSGPSTGMPTKQEQGDLNMMLYGGHGEIPRFVVAPTTIAECFHKTIEAFNFAEKYQTPVYLSPTSRWPSPNRRSRPRSSTWTRSRSTAGTSWTRTTSTRGRTRKTSSNPTSPPPTASAPARSPARRAAPTCPPVSNTTNSGDGPRTPRSRRAGRQAQPEGRDGQRRRGLGLPRVRRRGRRHPRHLVGVERGADARGPRLPRGGRRDVRFLSVPYIFPRPDLTEDIEAADAVIVVECNATGQFADVLEHDALNRVERVNKYNGVRFKADELADDIKAKLADRR